jgi:hypothetical protein
VSDEFQTCGIWKSSFGRVPWPRSAASANGDAPYRMCTPEIARATTSRWISEVPSKIV